MQLKLKLKLFLPICPAASAGLIIISMDFVKSRLWLAGVVVVLATAALASKQYAGPHPMPAASYPAHDAHPTEKISIAADPYDVPEKTEPVFVLPYLERGYLPIFLVVTNDGDQPVSLFDMKVSLVTASRTKLQPATDDDLYRRFSRVARRGDEPSRNPLPIPLPRKSSAGLPKGGAIELQSAPFAAKAVEPHSTQSGFLFFDVSGIRQPLAGAHLYITSVRDSNGEDLMFFDIPLDKYVNAAAAR